MRSVVVIGDYFTTLWPFAEERIRELWEREGKVDVIHVPNGDETTLGEIIHKPEEVDRLMSFRVPVTLESIKTLSNLKEAVFDPKLESELSDYAEHSGIRVYRQPSVGFWGQSVAECALALTLCALRRIPQLHHEMSKSLEPWNYEYRAGPNGDVRGSQFCDDTRFTNGTVEGKRVRIVGAGNIGSRYASFMNMLGADVAIWDPYATDPCFHRAGARKIYHLEELVQDAEIFAPMRPLNDTTGAVRRFSSTLGVVTAKHIKALPKGCLILLATRARICDTDAIRERVLADELALAADVFDVEPVDLNDPLLGRHNVVHTPHIGGRTKNANISYVDMLADQFLPR